MFSNIAPASKPKAFHLFVFLGPVPVRLQQVFSIRETAS